jgi:hypothetical protein
MPALFSAAELEQYARDGYTLARRLFSLEEITLLADFARRDSGLAAAAYGRQDSTGQPVKLALWNAPGDDLYGLFSRSRRIVDRMEQLLQGEVYHWHAKMILKEPHVGGAWEWHQDYGYWHYHGCLAPLLASCWIAIDRSTRANGCLQVLKGSHTLGRLDHTKTGEQSGADPLRVQEALRRFELEYIACEPGDALFFHCNLLHRSDQNRSDEPRWSLICCYNAARNSPERVSRHPAYSPLQKVGDEAILDWKARSNP